MKKALIFAVILLSYLAFSGEKIGLNEPEKILTSSATELIEKILGEDWENSDERLSYFTIDSTKEVVFSVAVQTGMMMGMIPIVSDFEGGVIVMSTSPNQALSGTVFLAFHIEEITFGEITKTAVTMKTNKLYYSKYLGWETDSSTGAIYHKLAAIIFSTLFHVKETSYGVIEGMMTDPEKTLDSLKKLLGK
ncbi:hypothetical protein [Kosmotoga sp. DU53]|uniref:hypothetical protein n=1 Tax=Kosmotoga sp. DU53 TaxID=1310160 RepID=UPI0007C5D3E0|nr:hypothetical protein [Kosmotoga sp. DU53]OAA23719.1 hypothetical protein DU53_02485 [Kosmotoga sp. DU53]